MTRPSDEELTQRAIAAYYRSARGGEILDQPSSGASGVTEHEGKEYVILRNVNGVLAVYRVRPSGALKGLRRWPKELD